MSIRITKEFDALFGQFPASAIVVGLSTMQENLILNAGCAERVTSITPADSTVICVNQRGTIAAILDACGDGLALNITGTPASTATVGTAYSAQFTATGGTGPYTFSLASGSLPAGLALNPSTGAISGTPTTAGTSSGIVIRVTDATSTAVQASAFQIVVSAAAGAAPVNTALPAISGTAQEGQTLTVSNGTWSNSPTSYSRQWKRNGANISGATATTYQLVSADVGATITATVTATNANGSTSATSAVTAAVTAAGGGLDTRPRFFVAPATAHNTGTQAFLTGATALTGSSNGGKSGNFSLTTTAGNYGWLAVLASASSAGVVFTDSNGAAGDWNGAGLAGANTGASNSPATSTTLFTDADGTQWRLFRQDYPNSNPTASAWTIS